MDANEDADDILIDRIDLALKRSGRGMVIAINEGVLVSLIKKAESRPWALAARDRLLQPYIYRGKVPKTDPSVCIVDLNLRNNLSEDIVRRVLDCMLKMSAPCDGCPIKTCSLQMNAQRLANGSAADRMVSLLEAARRTGFHATMRDVQGFFSYLLFGGDRCEDFKNGTAGRWYWESGFQGGQGPLFDVLRGLDPQVQTTPLLDDLLWRRADQQNHWEQPLSENAD